MLNLAHEADEIEAITRRQIDILFPRLRALLDGSERVAVDFGCGTGRFTIPLAETIHGRVVAVDPIQRLLDLAPRHRDVDYRLMSGTMPMQSASADVIWVCLVLGTIVDGDDLARTASEIDRVLAPRGLLFLVENTSGKPNLSHFTFRSAAVYKTIFPNVDLRAVGEYDDAGERISILAGRKRD